MTDPTQRMSLSPAYHKSEPLIYTYAAPLAMSKMSSDTPKAKRKRRSSVHLLGRVMCKPKYYEEEEYMEMAIKDIKKAWSGHIYAKNYSIKVLEDGFLRFNFKDPVDKKWVMDERPWVLDWQYFLLVLEEWSPSVPLSLMKVDSCPFWIQAVGIPVELLSTELGYDIGKVFGGEPLRVDDFSDNEGETPDFLRVRVMVNVDKRVISGCWLALPKSGVNADDKLLWVSFEYEDLPCMCYTCGKMGHLAGRCSILIRYAYEEESNELNHGNVIISYNGGENEKPVVREGDIVIDMRKIAYQSWLETDEYQLKEIQTYRTLEDNPKMNREGKIVVARNKMPNGGYQVNEENAIGVVLEPMPQT